MRKGRSPLRASSETSSDSKHVKRNSQTAEEAAEEILAATTAY